MQIGTLETACLGNRCYVIVEAGEAIVVDPPRDIDRVEHLADATGADAITLVVETHRHADYVSGGLELSRRHRAIYVVPSGDPEPLFDFRTATHGDVHGVGDVGLRVIATPGHTPHHVAYALEHGGRPVAVCTGGSLLHGSVGRTDLFGAGRTETLAHAQWQSAHRLMETLPSDVLVLPTHGFGSLCSAGGVADPAAATLADESATNPALQLAENAFVATLVRSFGPIPRHYARLPLLNAAGPAPIDLSPPAELSAADLAACRADGTWLVDVRDRRDFARRHLRGSVNVDPNGPLVAYLPWLLPPGAGVALLGDRERVDSAARQLTNVGIDRPMGVALGDPESWGECSSYALNTFDGYLETVDRGDTLLLDVRSAQEWNAGHVRGALHLSLPDLARRLDPSPGTPSTNDDPWARAAVWVYCGGGFRAAIAASLLDAAGVRVTLVDEPYDAAQRRGLTATAATRGTTAHHGSDISPAIA